jgi:Mg-chelatase subunit ChlD
MESGGALLCLLIDISGSTSRASFNAAVNAALPRIRTAVERRDPARRICLASYGTSAEIRVPPIPAGQIDSFPALTAGGLSSLAAGLRLVARTLAEEAVRPVAAGIAGPEAVVVVFADGLPTDPDEQVLAARAELDAVGPVTIHVACAGAAPALALAGLRARTHRLPDGGAELVVAAFLQVLGGVLDDVPRVAG